MIYVVQQQAKSGLGELVWLSVAGPFASRAEVDAVVTRRAARISAAMRVVETKG